MRRSLLLGAGHSRVKKLWMKNEQDWLGELTTIDIMPGVDVVWDLNKRPLPFEDETFDELAAYDVLEHLGTLGDWKGYFDEMAEYHRILKKGGTFGIIVPIGEEAFSDPGHTRVFHANHFGFLNQKFYAENQALKSPATDYTWYWKLNFETIHYHNHEGKHLSVVLQK